MVGKNIDSNKSSEHEFPNRKSRKSVMEEQYRPAELSGYIDQHSHEAMLRPFANPAYLHRTNRHCGDAGRKLRAPCR